MITLKLAFTTLGCPNWDMETIISQAVECGYDGVDFRGFLGQMEIYKLPEFSSEIETTKKRFNEAALEIPCFSSSVRLFTTSEEELNKFLGELKEYGKLCNEFNTPYIRVFGGSIGNISREEAFNIVESNLRDMLKIAEEYDITLLLETHDDWTRCEYVHEILKRAESKHIQVLWDIHHPYRTVGESPQLTWDTLGENIKYTHWKDSYIKKDTVRGYQLCLLGKGDIPLGKIYHILRENGYTGYFTLEWEKLWCPEIEEPEVAFSQYARFMKELEKEFAY